VRDKEREQQKEQKKEKHEIERVRGVERERKT